LELKCKSYERNKKRKKEKQSNPSRPARHPRRLVRRILRAAHLALSPRGPVRVSPIFFYFPDFSEPISTQTRISQDLQRLFRMRLFLRVPNSKPYVPNRPIPLYIAPTFVHLTFFRRNPKSSLPKLCFEYLSL
jgi:hypothetical protein